MHGLSTEIVTEILSYSVKDWQQSLFEPGANHVLSRYQRVCRRWQIATSLLGAGLLTAAGSWFSIIENQILISINKWSPIEFREKILNGAASNNVSIIKLAYLSNKAYLLELRGDDPIFYRQPTAADHLLPAPTGRLHHRFRQLRCLPMESEAIIWATQNNCYKVVKALIEQGVDVNSTSRGGTTPLFESAGLGSSSTVHLLLANGADPNARIMDKGKTALFAAIYTHKVENDSRLASQLNVDFRIMQASKSQMMTRLLLDNKANLSIKSEDNESLLWRAANCGHAQTIRLLLAAGAKNQLEDCPTFTDGHTPLMVASLHRYTSAVEALLEGGANIKACSQSRLDALALAIRGDSTLRSFWNPESSVTTIKTLLDNGADVNGDGHLLPPLSQAIGWANLPAIKMLLEAGADMDRCDVEGHTPLEIWLALRTGYVPPHVHTSIQSWLQVKRRFDEQADEIFQLFLRSGADLNGPSTRGNSILHEVCSCHTLENGMRTNLIKMLLLYGAHIDSPSAVGETPLMMICENTSIDETERLDVLFAFQRHSVNLDLTDNKGETALIKAFRNPSTPPDDFRSIEFLLANGANIDTCNSQGDTPLLIVCGSEILPIERKIGLLFVLNRGRADMARINHDGDGAMTKALNTRSSVFIRAFCGYLSEVEWFQGVGVGEFVRGQIEVGCLK